MYLGQVGKVLMGQKSFLTYHLWFCIHFSRSSHIYQVFMNNLNKVTHKHLIASLLPKPIPSFSMKKCNIETGNGPREEAT